MLGYIIRHLLFSSHTQLTLLYDDSMFNVGSQIIGGFTGGLGGFNPPPQMSAPTPQKKSQSPSKNSNPPRLRGYSHEKEVLRVSQSINSDFLQKIWGFASN